MKKLKMCLNKVQNTLEQKYTQFSFGQRATMTNDEIVS